MPQEQRERDESLRVSRQKVLLRASAELAIAELVRLDKGKGRAASQEESEHGLSPGQDWLFSILRDLLASDKEHTSVPSLLTLLKALGSILVGSASTASAGSDVETTSGGMASLSLLSETKLVCNSAQARFRKLCETYCGTLVRRMLKEHERLQDQDKRNHEAYIRSGEIFEDRQQNYEKMIKSFERTHEWAKQLCELLGVPLPPLTTDTKNTGVGLAINMDKRQSANEQREAEYASGKSLWEDEDTRRFYEDLVDLADMVPASLLGTSKDKPEETPILPNMQSTNNDAGGVAPQSSSKGAPRAEIETKSPSLGAAADLDNEKDEGSLNAGPAAQLNAFLARLPELSSRAMMDSAAVDFAFLNNKAARRRLVKQLTAVPRSRSDIIPYYTRLIATLTRYMPDIGSGVLSVLDEEFRYIQKKRTADLFEARAKNMRFIGELVKFRITPVITTFHCFKVLLDDFNRANVEMVAVLLETCGRFLLRSEETHERMKSVLEMLRRKRAAQNLDQRQLVLLDNAYYQCNPPEREAIVAKQKSPLELYINALIYDELNRQTAESVLKRCRKLPWHDALIRETLQNAFVRAWRIKFSHLHLLAVMLYELQKFHPDFAVYVVDTVCEQVRAGMEENVFRDNQRRVATVKYLGEMYNYRLVNTGLIFDQLWSLVTFGHPDGRPLPGQISPIDAPDDYFRIRLVCTLLDTCGHCFDRGSTRKRLDDFLLFFNIYILSKAQPLPMDVDFMLSDTMEVLRPSFVLKHTFDEAAAAVDEMLVAQRAQAAATAIVQQPDTKAQVKDGERTTGEDKDGVESESSSSGSDGDDSDSASAESLATPRHVSKDDVSTDSESSSSGESSSGEDDDRDEDEEDAEASSDEEVSATRRGANNPVDQEAEDEFSRDLAKMMAESNAAASAPTGRNQRGLFDIGLPFVRRTQAQTQANAMGDTGVERHVGTSDTHPPRAGSSSSTQAQSNAHPATAPAVSALSDSGALPPQHMRFSLLSKRGNKQQTHEVHVPMDAALAVHSRANEQQQMAEREQLKKLVLGIETREQANDRNSECD